MSEWPSAELDPVAQLHVLARVLPATVIVDAVIDAPFERLWGFVADLETSVARFDSDVSRVVVRAREGTTLRIRSWAASRFGRLPLDFDVDLRDGWCWMQSPLYLVGMAARPEGPGATRYAHLEGLPMPSSTLGRGLLAPVARLARWRHDHHVPHDVQGIARELGAECHLL